jgi:dTDP-4-amino-4,6-dideoxygalactose transaminase
VNAFAIRGAKIVFVDIDPLTMNIDESLIETAITEKTKAIVAVHYAGVSCNMDVIKHLADKYNLYIIEDAAQAMFAKYKNQYLGTIGDFGAFSFHETKNFSMGEGGALLINNKKFIEKAEIIREKGTNRSNFLKGYVDKYTWVSLGSSYLPSDILAAYLYPQLIKSSIILEKRMQLWNQYYLGLSPLKDQINLPYIPDYALHNAHIFYIKCKSETIRDDLMGYLKNLGITTVFHYVPLHSSIAGQKYGRMNGFDVFTSAESSKLLRLPLYFNLDFNDINHVVNAIFDFFKVD